MAFIQEMPPELRRGIIASVLFHLLLLVVFVLVQVSFEVTPASFAEVAFIAGTPGGATTAASPTGLSSAPRSRPQVPAAVTRPAVRRPQEQAVPLASRQEKPPAMRATPAPPRSSPVVPPKRRMLEEEEPLLSSQENGKITPGRTAERPAGLAGSGGETGSGPAAPPAVTVPAGGAGSALGSANQGSAGTGQGSGVSQGAGAGQPFTIEGDAAQRLIIKQVIPDYPEGLQQEEVIRFRFTVQPDGRLSGLIPMRKGDPTLEKITLAALRQWLFSPLPAGAAQKPVQGIITFRYQLE
ncbi:MAG TPA: energy transducer TonB [bacterium]|nr:energy transducer TonB [bacterium]HQG44525.1 energy transducer TonB [bacterium]HQI50221.1 energy transducer TonB [bacterium]HQJ63989.1 energy transducer TonB [bacterium]